MHTGEIVTEAFMAHGQGDLIGKGIKKRRGLLTEIVSQIHPVQACTDEVPGKRMRRAW